MLPDKGQEPGSPGSHFFTTILLSIFEMFTHLRAIGLQEFLQITTTWSLELQETTQRKHRKEHLQSVPSPAWRHFLWTAVGFGLG